MCLQEVNKFLSTCNGAGCSEYWLPKAMPVVEAGGGCPRCPSIEKTTALCALTGCPFSTIGRYSMPGVMELPILGKDQLSKAEDQSSVPRTHVGACSHP